MSANEVFVSLDFTEADEGWGVTKFNSVEKAVLNVADGGTVRVAAGIYDEKIAIDGSTLSADKAFSLVGEKDAAGNLLTTFTGELVLGSYHRSPVPELNLQKGIDITDIAFAPAGDTAIDLSSIYSLNISGCEFTGDATGKDQLITARSPSNVGGIAVDGCTFENGYITLNSTAARSKGGFGFKLLNSKLAEAQINAPGVQQFIMQGNEISRTVPDGVEADNIYMVRIGTGASAIEDFQISGNTFTLANPSGSVLPVDEYWAAIVLRSSQASGIILTDNVFSSDLAEFSALYTNTSGLAEVSGNTIAVAGDKAIVNTTGECLDFSNNAWTDGAGNLLTDSSAIAGGIDGTVMASCYATSGTAGNYVYGVDEFIAKNGSAVGYSTETLKVDSAWSSYSFGDAIDGETGYYYGINAFSSLNDALAQKTAGTQTITTLSAIEETSDGGYALLGDLTLGGEKITYSGASLTFLGGGVNATLTVNADMALTTNSSGLLGVSYDGRPMTVKINSDVRAYIYYAYTGSTTIVNESGKLFATGEQLLARGTGTTITYNGNAAVGAAFEERTLQGGAGFLQLRDSGNIALNNTLFEVTAGAVSVNHISGTGSRLLLNNTYINDKGHPDSRNSQFIINAGDGLVQVDNHSSLVFSGSGVGTMTVNGNGSKLEITGNSLVSGYAVTNSGTIDVTGSALSAVSLANTGTVNVSGNSKISAAFTGELSIKDGAVLTTDGLTGTGHLVIDEGATATLSGSGFDFNGYIYGATNKYNQEGVAGFTLNIENAEDFSNSALYASNASRYNLMNSKVETTTLNVNATGKVAADKDSSVTVESAHILGALETSGELVADIFNIYAGFGADDAAGQVSLKSGSSTTVYRLLNIGTANRPDAKYNATATGDDEKIAKLDLDNATLKFVAIHGEVPHFYVGSDSSAGLLTATASCIELGENQSVDFRVGTLGTVVLSDTSFTLLRNSAFSNFGAVMTDYASTITVGGTFTNSGTITVDMTGAAANGLYKLIDNTGATAMTLADYGNVILNNAAGYTLSVIDNDLYALNADMSTIQVNAAWGGTAPGTEIVIDGKNYYYDINAYSSASDAFDSFTAETRNIELTGDQLLKTDFDDGGEWPKRNFDLALDGDLTLKAADGAESTLTLTVVDSQNSGGGSTNEVGELAFYSSSADQRATFTLEKGVTIDTNAKIWFGRPTQSSSSDTTPTDIVVNGNIIQQAHDGRYYGILQIQTEKDSTVLVNGSVAFGWTLSVRGAVFTVSSTGEVKASDPASTSSTILVDARSGVGGKFIVDGSKAVSAVVLDVDELGSFEMKNEAAAAFDTVDLAKNATLLVADGSTLTADAVTNAGTIQITGENGKLAVAEGGLTNKGAILFGASDKTVNTTFDVGMLSKTAGSTAFNFQNGEVTLTGVMADGIRIQPFNVGRNSENVALSAASATVNIAAGAVVNVHQAYIAENTSANEHTLNVYGTLNTMTSIFHKMQGNLNIYGTVTGDYMQAAGNVLVSGKEATLNLAGAGSNGSLQLGRTGRTFRIADGGTVIASGKVQIGYSAYNGTVEITGGGRLEAQSIAVNGRSTLTLDHTASLSFGSITKAANATITVDLSGYTDQFALLIENTGSDATDYASLISNWNELEAAGCTVVGNDLFLGEVDMTVFKVNADWDGAKLGAKVEDGFYYKVNAFSGINQALGEAAVEPEKIVIAAGTYDESAAQFVKGVEVASENAVFSNVWSFGVNSDTGRDFDMETAEKFTVTGDLTVGQFYAEKNANVYVKIDGNLTTVGSFGAKLATQVDVNGTVTVTPPQNGAAQVMVYGTMNVTGTLDVTTGAMGAVLRVGDGRYETEYGKGGVLNVSGADASVVLRNNTESAIPVTVSAMSSLNISGGATFANETGGMQNLGTVNVDNATLTLGGTLENSGTVTVSGTSVLDIGALTGEITLADGATLTDSSVGGTVSAEGSASVAGTTSVDRLVLKGVRGENSELSIGADAVVAVKQLEVGTGLQKPDLVPGDTAAREYFSKAQIDGTLTVDRANQSGAIYIRPYAELVVTGTLNVKGEVHNRGSLVVDGGTMNISDWETPKLLGYTTGDSLTVTNQGSMILTGVSAVTFGEAHASLAEMGVEAQYADGMFATISAGGKFEADTLAFRNDDDVTLTVTGEGSSFKLYSASGRTVTGTYNYAVNEGAIIVAEKASFDVSGLANAEFVNSGSITLSSASAKFATLTNNGTFTVSGASTLNIGTLTGNMLQVVADTTLTDSVIGGNVSVGFNAENAADTTLTLAGDTSIGTLYVGKENRTNDYKLVIAGEETTVKLGSLYSRTGSTTTISNGATLDISNYWQSKGTVTVDASTINHSGVNFYVYNNDSADTAAIALMNGAVLNHINAYSLTLGSTNETVSGVAKGNASVTLEGGSTLNVNRLYLNATGTVEEVAGAEAKTSLTAVDSTVTARGEVGIGAGATVSLGNSAFTANTLISSGAIVMDSLSTITCAGAFTSTGTITARVDAAQSGVSFVQKLINASTLTVNDSLTVEGGREGAQLVATGNALWLDNSDKSTILINSEYAGEVGSAIAGRDGYFFGFNALTEYSTSIGADSAVEFTGGSYSFADGFAFTGHTFTVSGDTSFDKVTGGAVAVTGGTLSIGTVDLTADIATLSGALLAFSGSGMADLANLVLTVSGTMANRTKYVLATGVKDDSFAITLNGETYELNVRKDGLLVGVENGELYVQKSDDWFMLSRDLVQTVLPEDGYAFGGSDMYESAVMSTERKLNVVTNSQNTGARVYGGGLLRNDALFSGTQKCEVTVTAGGVGKGVIGGNRVESGSIGGTLTSSVTIDSADGTFGFIVGGNQLTGGELNGFGGTSVTIQNGTFSMWISGGSVAGGDAAAQVMGNTNVTITGGTFNGTGVFGGGFVQENGTLNQVGNTNVTISGGTFAGNIYGGHGATNKDASPNGVLFGNTNITISGGIFNGNIYGGGFDQSKVQGDTHITFTGTAGADFSVNGIIDGDASNARYWSKGSFVTGDRYLTFDAFSGEFGATLITNIDQMEVTGGSDVNLKNQLDLSEVSQWEFDFGSSLEGFAQNDLAGDTLVLSGWEDQLGDEGWTVMSGSSITGFGEMEVTNGSNLIFAWNADEQYYLGSIGDEQFKLSMEDGAMKLAKLA